MSSVLDQVPAVAALTKESLRTRGRGAPSRPAARATTAARRAVPLDAAGAEVLRTIADSRTPVFITVHANGRRRYGYWRPYDSRTRTGGCYVALPTPVCDQLQSAGRITFGEPLVDPAKTTYRVRLADTPAEPARTAAAPARTPAAPVRRLPVTPARAVARTLAA
ncbi:hypothetical protein ABT381_23095 [Streptomyces sp. NPDC000151]|uniref:hypothetical protein n=1 Tax=Streptomyces sp. NPDC000151 TaxID=3154244 RepID=UPI00331A5F24